MKKLGIALLALLCLQALAGEKATLIVKGVQPAQRYVRVYTVFPVQFGLQHRKGPLPREGEMLKCDAVTVDHELAGEVVGEVVLKCPDGAEYSVLSVGLQ